MKGVCSLRAGPKSWRARNSQGSLRTSHTQSPFALVQGYDLRSPTLVCPMCRSEACSWRSKSPTHMKMRTFGVLCELASALSMSAEEIVRRTYVSDCFRAHSQTSRSLRESLGHIFAKCVRVEVTKPVFLVTSEWLWGSHCVFLCLFAASLASFFRIWNWHLQKLQ